MCVCLCGCERRTVCMSVLEELREESSEEEGIRLSGVCKGKGKVFVRVKCV